MGPPAFLWLPIHVFRLLAAIALGRLDDVPPLMDRLRSSRGFHVAGGGGPIAYFGCVELHLGEAAIALRRWDEADAELRHAVAEGQRAGTPPFEIRAAGLLAEPSPAAGRKATPPRRPTSPGATCPRPRSARCNRGSSASRP